MGLLGNALKVGAAAKLAQVISREAKKPENRKKIQDAMASLKQRQSGKASGRDA